ncbi:uncharacterized protein LOC133343863 [Lethenteron reissneri]|uniref:uncharacterized protein LOC133343863 n=1 Tax=Lethenteron reissneri TaxID=7753 RepID=UPI002AB6FD08|nr:uncharacterized protein LOC133343863 [Lethenteron reissneri]
MMAAKMNPKMDTRHGRNSIPGFSREVMSPDSSYQENFLDDKDLREMTEGFRTWTKDPVAQPHVQVVVSSPSFSMLSAQGRDRGVSVLWETTPDPRSSSRSSWTSGCSTSGVYSPPPQLAPPPPPSRPLAASPGRIIFIMSGKEVVLGKDCERLAPRPRTIASTAAAAPGSRRVPASEPGDQPSEDETAAGWYASGVLSADEGVGMSQESDLEQSVGRFGAQRLAEEYGKGDLLATAAAAANVGFTRADPVETEKIAHEMSLQKDVSLAHDLRDATQLQKSTLSEASIESVGELVADSHVTPGTLVAGDGGAVGDGDEVFSGFTQITEVSVAEILSSEPISIKSAFKSPDEVKDNTPSENASVHEFQEVTSVTALDTAVPRDGLIGNENKVGSLSLDKGQQGEAKDDIKAEETVKQGAVVGISTTVTASDVPALCADEFLPADTDNAKAADSVSQIPSGASTECVESAVETPSLPSVSQATAVGITAEVTVNEDGKDESVDSVSNISYEVAASVALNAPKINVEQANSEVPCLQQLAETAAREKQDHGVSEVAPQGARDAICRGAFGVNENVDDWERIAAAGDQERGGVDTKILTSDRHPADEITGGGVKRPDDSQRGFNATPDRHDPPLGTGSTDAQAIYDADYSEGLEESKEPMATQAEIISGAITPRQTEHTAPLCYEESVYPLENISGEHAVSKDNAADTFATLVKESEVQMSEQMATAQLAHQAVKPFEDMGTHVSAERGEQHEASDIPPDEPLTSECINASEVTWGEGNAVGMDTAEETVAEVEYFHDITGQVKVEVEQSGDSLQEEGEAADKLSGKELYEGLITERHDAPIAGDRPEHAISVPMFEKSIDREEAHLEAEIMRSHGFPVSIQQDTQMEPLTEKPTDAVSEIPTQFDNSLQEGTHQPWDGGDHYTQIFEPIQAETSTVDVDDQTQGEGYRPISSEPFVAEVEYFHDITCQVKLEVEQSGDSLQKEGEAADKLSGKELYEGVITEGHDAPIAGDRPDHVISVPMFEKSIDREEAHLEAEIMRSHGFPVSIQQDTQMEPLTEKPTDAVSEISTQFDNSLQEGTHQPWDGGDHYIQIFEPMQAETSAVDVDDQTQGEGYRPISSEPFVTQVSDDAAVPSDPRDAGQLVLPVFLSELHEEEIPDEVIKIRPCDAVESEVCAALKEHVPECTHAVFTEPATELMEEPHMLGHDTMGTLKEHINDNVDEEKRVDLQMKEPIDILDQRYLGTFKEGILDDADKVPKIIVTESAEGLEERESLSLGALDEEEIGRPGEYVDEVTITEIENVYEGEPAEVMDYESIGAFKWSTVEGDNEEIKPFVIEPAEELDEFEMLAGLDQENIGVFKEHAPGEDVGEDGEIIITELTAEFEGAEAFDELDHDNIGRLRQHAPANMDEEKKAFVTEPAGDIEEVECIDVLDQENTGDTKEHVTLGVDKEIKITFTEFEEDLYGGEHFDISDYESIGAFKDHGPESAEGVLDPECIQAFKDRAPENVNEHAHTVSAGLPEDLGKEEPTEVMDQEETHAFSLNDDEMFDQEMDEGVTDFLDAEEGSFEGRMDEIHLELDREASLGSEVQSEEGIDFEVWKAQRGLGDFAELYEHDISLEAGESIEDPDASLISVEDEDFDDAMDKEVEEYMDAEDFDIAAMLAELESGSEAERKLKHPDVYCITCKKPIPALDKLFGDHKHHRVTALKTAVRLIKAVLKENTKILMERSNDVVDLQKLLYEISDSLEENFNEQEQAMQEEFDTLMRVLSDRYAELCVPLEEEKKAKLEALYEQLVQCRCSLESTRALIAEAQALDPVADRLGFLVSAEDLKARLDLALTEGQVDQFQPSASAEFQNAMPDLSHEKSILDESSCVSVPSPPTIRPQEPAGATTSSVLVQWTAEPDDTVDHYNVFYLAEDDFQCEDTDTVNVRQEAREDSCLIEDLEPNTFYVFWVSAVNTAGASPPSDCVTYCTVPEPPVILVEECTACMDAATIRWDSGNVTAVESYSLEHCMQAEGDVDDDTSESHITRCISGIRDCEWVVRLQPGQTYALYVRAVNSAGPSQRSDPVLIRTKGTQFLLRKESAHPRLIISEDGAVIEYDGREDEYLDPNPNRFSRCMAVLGELTPSRGRHYWEVSVGECEGYRIGVAYPDTPRDGLLGQNDSSWCMRLVCTPARHKYEFLHASRTPDIRTTLVPARIGVLLDFDAGRLAFFDAERGQLLFSFRQRLQGLLQPAFALDQPGMLVLHTGLAPPAGLAYC